MSSNGDIFNNVITVNSAQPQKNDYLTAVNPSQKKGSKVMQILESKSVNNTVCEYIPFQTSMNGSLQVMYSMPLNSDAFTSSANEIPNQMTPRTTIIEVKLKIVM